MMIWVAALIVLVVPLAIWRVLVQEEALDERRRSPMGWIRRLWAKPGPNRRHCHRYRATVPLTYRVMETAPKPVAASQTRDISFGGLGIVLYEKLPVGTTLELSLQGTSLTGVVAVQGVVQWVREVPQQTSDPRRQFWAGVQLLHTGMASIEHLRALLEQISPDGRRARV